MMWILHGRGTFMPDALLKSRLVKLLIASVVMAATLLLAGPHFEEMYHGGIALKTMGLGTVIIIGGAAYSIAVLMLQAYDVALVNRLLKRRPSYILSSTKIATPITIR